MSGLDQLVQACASSPTPPPSERHPDKTVTSENIAKLYERFIHAYHRTPNCRIPDHLNKFSDPPTYNKKSFSTFQLFAIVKECGGVYTLQKSSRQWTPSELNAPAMDSLPRNWTQVAICLGYDTKATNISYRIKEWLRFHHIDAFFDYLMGISHEFFDPQHRPNGHQRSNTSSPRFMSQSPLSPAHHGQATPSVSNDSRYGSPGLTLPAIRGSPLIMPPPRSASAPILAPLGPSPRLFLEESRKRPRIDEEVEVEEPEADLPPSPVHSFSPEDQLKHLQSELIKAHNHIRVLQEQIFNREGHLKSLSAELHDKSRVIERFRQFKHFLLRDLESL